MISMGRVKKITLWSGNPPPSVEVGKKVIFSETRPFFSTFCKKCIFTIENPKKIYKQLLDKLLFAYSDARFFCKMHNDGCYTQNCIRDTRNFSIDMILSP